MKGKTMTELSVLDTEKTAEDLQVAGDILSSIGPLNVTALGIERGFVFIEDKAVSLRNVVVGFRKQGTVNIALNAKGLYDMTVLRRFRKESEERVVYEWKSLDSLGIRSQLASLWTYTASK